MTAATTPANAALNAISPIDGRYAPQTRELAAYFSESALIRRRIAIELAWLQTIAPILNNDLPADVVARVCAAIGKLAQDDDAPAQVKALEARTRHDVKAVEYWIGQQIAALAAAPDFTAHAAQLQQLPNAVHFGCTSWDINNIALAQNLMGALQNVLLPALNTVDQRLRHLAKEHAHIAMLSRTHGQPASPTTVGKEFANFVARLHPRLRRLRQTKLPAKFSGATGNYNAHLVARPDLPWPDIARDFVQQQGCTFAAYATQIEPYDDLADLFDTLRRVNTILLDLCRDCWGYIALNYFTQKTGGDKLETGSSTMPHKINPIDFENAEGNLGIANALLGHFADKLPVSRWQRDLSDSTVLRAIGGALAHTLIAWRAAAAGLAKIAVNEDSIVADLNDNKVVWAEAVQTVMREQGIAGAYDKLRDFTRGRKVTIDSLVEFINEQPIDLGAKKRLTVGVHGTRGRKVTIDSLVEFINELPIDLDAKKRLTVGVRGEWYPTNQTPADDPGSEDTLVPSPYDFTGLAENLARQLPDHFPPHTDSDNS